MKQLIAQIHGLVQVHSDYRQPLRTTVMLVALLAFGAVLSLPLSVISGMRGIASYLPLHMLFETFSIVVAMLAFAVGWHAHHRNLPGNIVLLACAFFGVGLLDFAHMLSYAGMPDFVTLSNPEKAIDFWLVARSLAAVALLAVALMPWRPFASTATRYSLFAAVLAATALAYWLILFHQDEMPHTFIPGKGLTAFKITSEYAVIALNLAAALALWIRMRQPQPFNVPALFGAVCVMALSEVFFTLYASVTDLYNLLGHVYKTIAYLLLFRAFFTATVETPYRQLQLSQIKLRGTLDAIPDLVWLKDTEGIYLDCNTAFERFFGARRAHIVGKTDYDFVSREQANSFSEHDRKVMAANKPSANEEWLTYAVDGDHGLFETVKTPMRDDVGKQIGVLGIARDITGRKKNEAKIERLSRAYRLLSRVNEAIVHSPGEKELFTAICNSAVETGLFRLAWIGVLDETRSCVTPVASAGVEDGYTSRLNIRLDDERTGNGPIATVLRTGRYIICQNIENDPGMSPWREDAIRRGYRSSVAFPLRNEGYVIGTVNAYAVETNFFTPDIIQLMLELSTDVSFALDVLANRKRREQAEAEILRLNVQLEQRIAERTRELEVANKELEAFSYSVSHDLRAPLRSIDGFSKVLMDTCHDRLDATAQNWLGRVRRASQHMGHLIDDMLQLSQVSRSALQRMQIDLGALAKNAVDDLRHTHPERQVRFTLQEGLDIYGDPGLMRIVINNLLGNAWKYTGKTTVAEIEFGACDISSDTGEERGFFVRDNGAGFNMDYAHKLFGPFQRLHGTDEFEGTGIGLATVQRIIHRHHGRVWAEAKEGEGATFYFTLPPIEPETNTRKPHEQ